MLKFFAIATTRQGHHSIPSGQNAQSENDREAEALTAYQSGIRQLDNSITSDENDELAAQFWALIGDLQAESGQINKAIEAYEEARRFDPTTYGHLDRVIQTLIDATPEP